MPVLNEQIHDGSRWGFYGGAFDPPHVGHLELAAALSEAESLDGILVVPSFHPPHKSPPEASFNDRLSMCNLAFKAVDNYVDNYVVSDIESRLPTPGYTVDVISELYRRFPKAEFSVLVGADNLRILSSWHKIETLLRLAPLVVGSRPQYASHLRQDVIDLLPADLQRRVHIVQTPLIDVSSTTLRTKLHSGERVGADVQPDVQEYIREHGLYQ